MARLYRFILLLAIHISNALPRHLSKNIFWGGALPSSSGDFDLSSKVKYKEVNSLYSKGKAYTGHDRQQCGDDVYLSGTFACKETGEQYLIRQVPGDGGCLFHALTVTLIFEKTHKHLPFDKKTRNMSDKLRKLCVLLLKRKDVSLFIENGECTTSSELLRIVSDHYNMTETEYCEQMMLPTSWGGGPEIVALSNHLERPIHVFELCRRKCEDTHEDFEMCPKNASRLYELKICGKFGSPEFDDEKPLKILCADGRFPNLLDIDDNKPGDHFFALETI